MVEDCVLMSALRFNVRFISGVFAALVQPRGWRNPYAPSSNTQS